MNFLLNKKPAGRERTGLERNTAALQPRRRRRILQSRILCSIKDSMLYKSFPKLLDR
ncbi:hypothetical protein CLOM621_08744 [Clostridium sp. M62/1]|nr:hypothetical protein CLOM621_08744 [Clostridium sp. M62/1]